MSDDGAKPAAVGDNDGRDRDYAVRVKPEYVLSERPSCLAPPPSPPPPPAEERRGNVVDADDDDNNDNRERGKKNGKNNRGMNKKRPRDAKIDYGEKACLAVVRGLSCPFLLSRGGCKYNHDLREMLANRPRDIHEGEGGAAWLEGGCPFWIARG